MNDWSSFASTLDFHRRAYEAILTNYPAMKPIDEATQLQIDAHLDAIVGCCNQVDAWVANNGE